MISDELTKLYSLNGPTAVCKWYLSRMREDTFPLKPTLPLLKEERIDKSYKRPEHVNLETKKKKKKKTIRLRRKTDAPNRK